MFNFSVPCKNKKVINQAFESKYMQKLHMSPVVITLWAVKIETFVYIHAKELQKMKYCSKKIKNEWKFHNLEGTHIIEAKFNHQ